MDRAGVSPPLELVDPAARPVIVEYLAGLAAGLPCGRSARAAIVAEVGDGLVDAVQAHLDEGVAPGVAARAAVAEFGDPRILAAGFARELAGAAAHRVGLALVATGPVVGSVWVAAYAARSGLSWWAQLGVLWSAIPVYGLILAVAVPAALLAVGAGSGRLPGCVPIGTRGAAIAALVASVGCVAGDATLLTGLAVSAGSGWTLLGWVAGAISVVRLSGAFAAGRRCARLRAAAG
jgi:hypothetical protein